MSAGMWEWLVMGMFLCGQSASLSFGVYSAANLLTALLCKPSSVCFLPAWPHQQGKHEQGFSFPCWKIHCFCCMKRLDQGHS